MRRIGSVLATTRAVSAEGNEGKCSILLLSNNKTNYRIRWNKYNVLVKYITGYNEQQM